MSPLRYRLVSARMRPIVVGLATLTLATLTVVAWLVWGGAVREPVKVLDSPIAPARRLPEASVFAPVQGPTAAVEKDLELVEVCGLGWLEPKENSAAIDAESLEQIPGFDASRRAIVDALRESPDEFARAAGLVLDEKIDAAGRFDTVPIEQLARRAATTDDPRVYALAFRSCVVASAGGSCALLNAAQWARLDEGNAAPWLFMLEQAAARDDRAQVDEALYRIGSAKRFEDRFAALAAPIFERGGDSDTDLVAVRWLALQVTVSALALPLPLQPLARACGVEAVLDVNRKQVCDAVATTLGEHSDSLLVSMIGASIGKRVGWPVDRVLSVRALSLVVPDARASASHGTGRPGGGSGCADVRADVDNMTQLARVGEPQMARRWLAANGKSLAPYLEAAREIESKRDALQTELAANRAAAASAAPASVEQR